MNTDNCQNFVTFASIFLEERTLQYFLASVSFSISFKFNRAIW